MHAQLLGRRVVVHKRRDEGVHGLFPVAGEAAVHGGVVHHVRVAGVVGGHIAVADVRILVLDGDADLDQRQGAHVLRYARRDGLVYVVAAVVLVHDGHHEGRVLLDVDGLVAGEAEHDVLGQRVVEAYGPRGPLRLAEAAVGADELPDGVDGVRDHSVYGVVVRPERDAAVAAGPAVHHGGVQR